MNKAKKQEKLTVETITLSNDMKMYQKILAIKKDEDLFSFRVFFPTNTYYHYNQAIEKKVASLLKTEFHPGYLVILFNYYLNQNSEIFTIAKYNPQGKIYRKLIHENLLLMENFNDDIQKLGLTSPARIRNYIKSLSAESKKMKLEKIRTQIFEKFVDKKTPLTELINSAFMEKIPENPFLTDSDFHAFVNLELKEFMRNQDYSKIEAPVEILNKLKIGVKDKFSLNWFSIIQEDEYFVQLSSKIKQKLELILESPEINGIDWREVNTESWEKVCDHETVSTIDMYIKDIHRHIDRKITKTKKNATKAAYIHILNMSKEAQMGDLTKKLTTLFIISWINADFDIARKRLLDLIEPILFESLRLSNKEALKCLIKEYNLTKEEIRLFILLNIGVKKYCYINFLSAPQLSDFPFYTPKITSLFLKEVILKSINNSTQDNITYLENHLTGFLVFYKTYVMLIRDYDKYAMQYFRHKEDLSIFDESIFSSTDSAKTIDITFDDEEYVQNDDPKVENDIEDPQLEPDLDGSDEHAESKHADLIMHINNSPNTYQFISEFPRQLIPFITKDLITVYCDEIEAEIIERTILNDEPEKYVATELDISQQTINRYKKRGLEKISKSAEFKKLYRAHILD